MAVTLDAKASIITLMHLKYSQMLCRKGESRVSSTSSVMVTLCE